MANTNNMVRIPEFENSNRTGKSENENLERTAEYVLENLDRTEKTLPPTEMLGTDLQAAHSYYNKTLFNGELADAMLTLDQSGKTRRGYSKPESFVSKYGVFAPEISLGATYVLNTEISVVLSTLVHEMCHQFIWELFDKKPSGGYHCKRWVGLMEGVGLIPSNTGEPGGNKTGYQMTHYIEMGGLFDRATKLLLEKGFAISWGLATQELRAARLATVIGKDGRSASLTDKTNLIIDVAAVTARTKKARAKGKVRFACPECSKPAWAASSRLLICGDCQIELVEGA